MDNKMTQLIVGILISGAVGVGIVYFADSSTESVPANAKAGVNAVNSPAAAADTVKTKASAAKAGKTPKPDKLNDKQPHEPFDIAKIEAMFKSKDPSEREDAFLELRYAKDTYDITKLMPFLHEGVKDEEEAVREAAVDLIGEYTDDPRILPAIESVMQSTYGEQKVEALNHVFNMDYSPQVEQLLISSMWDKDDEVAEQAFDILLQNVDEDFDDVAQAREFYKNRRGFGL